VADQRITESVRITSPSVSTQQAEVDASNRLTTISAQGTAAAGSGAWPVTVTTTGDTVVKPGDSVNNAVRVNIVADSVAGAPLTSPLVDQATSVAVAAGSSATLASQNIAAAVVTFLWGIDVTASVPLKIVITQLVNNVATSLNVLFSEAGQAVQWRPPDPRFFTFTAAGATNKWEAVVTNLDPQDAADVYAAFMYAQSG
jgi:hypothetical protein